MGSGISQRVHKELDALKVANDAQISNLESKLAHLPIKFILDVVNELEFDEILDLRLTSKFFRDIIPPPEAYSAIETAYKNASTWPNWNDIDGSRAPLARVKLAPKTCGHVVSSAFRIKYRDQGWGNRKGTVYVSPIHFNAPNAPQLTPGDYCYRHGETAPFTNIKITVAENRKTACVQHNGEMLLEDASIKINHDDDVSDGYPFVISKNLKVYAKIGSGSQLAHHGRPVLNVLNVLHPSFGERIALRPWLTLFGAAPHSITDWEEPNETRRLQSQEMMSPLHTDGLGFYVSVGGGGGHALRIQGLKFAVIRSSTKCINT